MRSRSDTTSKPGRGSPSSLSPSPPTPLGRETRRILTAVSTRNRRPASSKNPSRSSQIPKNKHQAKSTSGLRAGKRKADSEVETPVAKKLAKGPERQIIGGIGHLTDNTLCYVNAALQALAATSYPQWVAGNLPADGTDAKALTTRIHNVFDKVNQYYRYEDGLVNVSAVTPTPAELGLDDLEGRQQSSIELMTRLHERLVGESAGADNPLEGRVLQRLTCLGCGHSSWNESEFTTLRLEKPHLKRDGQRISLAGCFEFHRRVGARDGEGISCWRCVTIATRDILVRALKRRAADSLSAEQVLELQRRIDVASAALKAGNYGDDNIQRDLKLMHKKPSYPDTKGADRATAAAAKAAYWDALRDSSIRYFSSWSETHAISKLPQILVLEFGNVAGFFKPGKKVTARDSREPPKNINVVEYRPTQNLWRFLLGDEREASPMLEIKPKDGDEDTPEDAGEDADGDGRKGEEGTDPARTLLYDLRAVLIHRGRGMKAGHWVTYRREWRDPTSGKEEEWWFCNEHSTMRISRADVFGAVEDGEKREKGNMYGLVYERLPEGAKPATKPAKMPKTDWNLDEGRIIPDLP